MRTLNLTLRATAAVAICSAPALAQDQKPVPLTDAQWQQRFEALVTKNQEDIDDLKFQVETLEKDAAATRVKVETPPPQSAGIFNPAITAFGNFLARHDDQPVFVDDDPLNERVDNRMLLREAELDFRAPIDPWADGVLIFAFSQDVPNEFTAEVEEGYVTLKKLPLLDTAPWGLKVKAGRFRPEFGRFNYTHLHDLPQPSYPRAMQNFLGNEGLIQNGVSGQFFLPSPSEKQTLEATVQLLNGDNIPIAPNESGSDVALLEHVKWFSELTNQQSVELGGSSWISNANHQLYGVDATYKWKPLQAGESNSFLVSGELYTANLDETGLSSHPFGWYLWSQYQFSQNLYLGARFDQAQEVTDDTQVTDTIGVYVTYYTTEFLRFRIGVEHAKSDVALLDGRNTALFELNFIFGSHPVEPYWVNK